MQRGSIRGELTTVGLGNPDNQAADAHRGHGHIDPLAQFSQLPTDFRDIQNPDPEGEPLTEKQQIVMKLRVQNEGLKAELKGLGTKLEAFMQR